MLTIEKMLEIARESNVNVKSSSTESHTFINELGIKEKFALEDIFVECGFDGTGYFKSFNEKIDMKYPKKNEQRYSAMDETISMDNCEVAA